MLTKEHAIAEYKGDRVYPDRLLSGPHRHYLGLAEKMLGIYRDGIGRTRGELHREVRKVLAGEPDCPARRVDAFCKLLDDVSKYNRDRGGKAARLRKKVFTAAAEFHPLVSSKDQLFEGDEKEVKNKIAQRLGKSWEQIEGELFADIEEFHPLKEFEGYPGPRELLSRYNIAQVQAALYGAADMTVWAGKDFKTIVTFAKLAKLMHSIQYIGEGHYQIRFDGPASLLRQTRRYGVAMAAFFPSLAACEDWKMHATVYRGKGRFAYSLQSTSRDGLKSYLPGPESFDSTVEESFAKKWGEEKREGWSLVREGGILHQGQKVFLPDFVLLHEGGRKVYLEIVGFWTPEYLEAKVETLEVFKGYDMILAVAEDVAAKMPELPLPVVRYKTGLNIKDVLEALGRGKGSREKNAASKCGKS